MTRTKIAPTALVALTALAVTPTLASAAPAEGRVIYVSPSGSPDGDGSRGAPRASIQSAIDAATPGTTIRLSAGTYREQVKIKKSGAPGKPITITTAGNGKVFWTSTQAKDSCSNRQPSHKRTILISNGADHWTFSGLNLEHGAYISGKGSGKTYSWHAGLAKRGQWEPRRKVPGMSKNDPAAARGAIAYLSRSLGTQLDPADNIQFLNNTITGRGIYATLSGNGVVRGNKISNILCGTGPGVWVMNFSHFWDVSGNDISNIAPAVGAHFMHEGIRFGTAASYNRITGNRVHDLAGDGRAVNTDVDASWNVIENNSATNVAIGFNDQMAGWGNTWRNNTVKNYRTYGFAFRLKDATLSRPSKNSSTHVSVVSGNVATGAVGKAKALGVGAIAGSSFTGNSFPSIFLGRHVAGYWAAQGNFWNGSSRPPVK